MMKDYLTLLTGITLAGALLLSPLLLLLIEV